MKVSYCTASGLLKSNCPLLFRLDICQYLILVHPAKNILSIESRRLQCQDRKVKLLFVDVSIWHRFEAYCAEQL